MKNRGQSMVILVVLLPVLIVALGVIFRSGRILLAHEQIQNHCNKVVLDALAAQAQGLSALGKLNPVAKMVINTRRIVDDALEIAFLWPPAELELLEAQRTLVALQEGIMAAQKAITYSALLHSQIIMMRPPPNYGGKIVQFFEPANLLLPHWSPQALKLHVVKQSDYKLETGAPLELDGDFAKRQVARGTIEVRTETFLKEQKWPNFEALPSMIEQCQANIEMSELEGKWTIRLSQPEDKPWLKRLLSSPLLSFASAWE